MIALAAILAAVVAGTPIAAAVAAFSIPQWIALAGVLLEAEPAVVRVLITLHSDIAILHQQLQAERARRDVALQTIVHSVFPHLAPPPSPKR